jgi:hypothetical protein
VLLSRGVLKVCSVAWIAIAVGLTLVACGGSGASQEEIDRARREGAAKAKQQQKIAEIQRQLRNLKHGRGGGSSGSVPPSSPVPSSESGGGFSEGSCGGSLSVGPNTTCEFAQNVENDYYAEIGSGAGTVDSYSPAKDRYYPMYCTSGSPHECTGGNNASVYFP